MATIRKRVGKKGTTYDVQIRIKPYPHVSNSFEKLTDAKRWAEKTEMEMREKRFGTTLESRKKTLSDAIKRYRTTVLPGVTKSKREYLVDWWEKTIGHFPLRDITASLIIEVKDKLSQEEEGEKKRSASTILKYLATISHVLSKCVEWEWLDQNVVMKVSKPPLPRGRTRFLSDSEREQLIQACRSSRNPYLYTIVILAISTGMRRSEMLTLRWSDNIDFERGRIILRETKNGEVRVLPLVGLALQLLKNLEKTRQTNSPLLFPGNDPFKPIDFRSAWRVALNTAEISENFTFHDLRHTFASYCIMNGSSLSEVGDLLGHKSNITKRYCHLSDAHRKGVVVSMTNKIFGGNDDES